MPQLTRFDLDRPGILDEDPDPVQLRVDLALVGLPVHHQVAHLDRPEEGDVAARADR